MTAAGRRRLALLLFAATLALGVLASATQSTAAAPDSRAASIRVDPISWTARPGDGPWTVELYNDGAEPLLIDRVRIEGEDWMGFVVETTEHPRSIPPGDSVALRVRADTRHFSRSLANAEAGAPSGRATLRVLGPRLDARSELRFALRDAWGGAWSSVAGLIALFALFLLAARLGRLRSRATAAPPRRRGFRRALGLLLALGSLPLTFVVTDGVGQWVGAAQLRGIAGGHGGSTIRAIDLPFDVAFWAMGAVLLERGRGTATRLRWAPFGAALAIAIGGTSLPEHMLFGHGVWDRPALVLACSTWAWISVRSAPEDDGLALAWSGLLAAIGVGGGAAHLLALAPVHALGVGGTFVMLAAITALGLAALRRAASSAVLAGRDGAMLSFALASTVVAGLSASIRIA